MNVAFDHDRDSAQTETETIPNVAKRFKARNQPWALVVDDNYGEGSAREHAALQPRFYGLSTIYEYKNDVLICPRLCYDRRKVLRSYSRD